MLRNGDAGRSFVRRLPDESSGGHPHLKALLLPTAELRYVGPVQKAREAYIERVLFVIGDQDSGKSTQLRSMFLDRRLGTQGALPTAKKVRATYALSNERWLYLRLMSPHEAGETLDEFLDKCGGKMQATGQTARRWNLAGALQPTVQSRQSKLPDGPDVIKGFIRRFKPERVRAVILSPGRSGEYMSVLKHQHLTGRLHALPGVEVMTTDVTTRTANGLMYADFFDFT